MKVEFLFNDIKDINKLYTQEIEMDSVFGGLESYTVEKYIGKDYCEKIVSDVCANSSNNVTYEYKGSIARIANETFIISMEHKDYSIKFTIDTFGDNNKKKARMFVCIEDSMVKTEVFMGNMQFPDGTSYDMVLEQLKIAIQNEIKDDWKACTWIRDDQSESLCSQLYPLFFKSENNLRAFVSKVLSNQLGPNWLQQSGMELYAKSAETLSNDFKRVVPCYEGVDDTFMSMTLESTMKVIKKGKIYEKQIEVSGSEFQMIMDKLNSDKPKSLIGFFQDKRKVKVDLWEDIFKKYLEPADTDITDFIKNRNHIAHNKLLIWQAYQKMERNIRNVDNVIRNANEQYDKDVPSDEIVSTWEYEEETRQESEEWERNYLRIRIEGETGIEVRETSGIFTLFSDCFETFYAELTDKYYFNPCYEISEMKEIEFTENEQVLCTVKSNAKEESAIEIVIHMVVDDEMDADSDAVIICRKVNDEKTELFRNQISYHNGGGSENYEEGRIELSSESEFEDSEIGNFIEKLIEYIDDELNPLIAEKENLEYEAYRHGGNLPVAEFPCEECGNNGISISAEFYPVGKCCYCGCETDISICERCETPFAGYKKQLCDSCIEQLNKD